MVNSASPNRPPRFSRRFWLRSMLGGCLAAGGLLGWSLLLEPRWLAVSQHRIWLPNLPLSWQGRRLVQISDLHIGRVSAGYLRSSLAVVNSLKPDMLLITGDFVDYTGGIEELPSILDVLQPLKMGAFACLGNHDYGHQWSELSSADRVTQVADDYGIRVLRDQSIEVDGLKILGVDDYWSPRCNPTPLLDSLSPDQPSLALCHNPDACDRFNWDRFGGLVLAGHTHGGQCKPPFLPPPILPVKNPLYTSGFFQLAAQRQLYINRGVGHTLRIRFNCRPEITVFDLHPA